MTILTADAAGNQTYGKFSTNNSTDNRDTYLMGDGSAIQFVNSGIYWCQLFNS